MTEEHVEEILRVEGILQNIYWELYEEAGGRETKQTKKITTILDKLYRLREDM